MRDFVIARNPDPDSALPYLLRIPLGEHGIVLKARETWPRTSKVYCHRDTHWPSSPEIIETVGVRSCVRRGGAIDLVLDRGRESRSQFVLTKIRGGREAVFWQTARTNKKARPHVALPTARAGGLRPEELTIVVDSHERYPWKFSHQQVRTERRAVAAGDYGVEWDGRLVAAVERKSLEDLVSTLTTGKLTFVLAALAALPYAALVVEARYSEVFSLDRVRPALVADGIAEYAAKYPSVPIHFAENRKLAQEWTFHYLGACLTAYRDNLGGSAAEVTFTPATAPKAKVIRAWAIANGHPLSDRGRIPSDVVEAYLASHRGAR